MSKTLKQVKAGFEAASVYFDHVGRKQDGTFQVKDSFFYTHGRTAQGVADKVKKALPDAVIVSATQDWKQWPATSYFKVVFTFPTAEVTK